MVIQQEQSDYQRPNLDKMHGSHSNLEASASTVGKAVDCGAGSKGASGLVTHKQG